MKCLTKLITKLKNYPCFYLGPSFILIKVCDISLSLQIITNEANLQEVLHFIFKNIVWIITCFRANRMNDYFV